MKGHLTKSASALDRTDELPVLSEEAILKFELLEVDSPTADPDPLESSLEALRQALDQAEQRWSALESKLETQDHAITELKECLGEPSPQDNQTAAATEAAQPEPAAVADAASYPEDEPGADSATLERIASLESYIAGRADRWQEMDQELSAKTRRIAELESELEQRIAREQGLEERLHNEGNRSNELRDKLRRMHRQLEDVELGSVDTDLDATREMVGHAIDAIPIRFLNGIESNDTQSYSAPKLICLTSSGAEPYVLYKNAITIGRGSECDIQIVTDFVSRQHATIKRDDSETIIEDRSSTNGIFVNAERVKQKSLSDGDEITIGESRFRFLGGEPSH